MLYLAREEFFKVFAFTGVIFHYLLPDGFVLHTEIYENILPVFPHLFYKEVEHMYTHRFEVAHLAVHCLNIFALQKERTVKLAPHNV